MNHVTTTAGVTLGRDPHRANRMRSLLALHAVLLLTLPALAQGMRAPRVPIHTAADDLGQQYGTWAAGGTYKCSFHGDMTFVPYLGRDYPNNQPLSWRTTSVTVGGDELLAAGEAPRRALAEFRCEYRYRNFTEAYDVRDDGLEQSFVFESLPAAGELVITGAVTSMLRTADVAPTHGSLVFADEHGRELVNYGAAVAIDAAGDRLPLATGFERGAVTLRVPAGWLATARFPIVVDPLISLVAPFTNQAGNGFERVEIERDDEATGFTVMVAYVQSASGIDSDVSAFVVDDAFANAHSAVFSDITSTWDSDGVSCAYVGGANRWAISLRRFFINSSIRVSRLRFHGHPSGSTAFSSSVLATTPPTNENEWNPEIGGIRSNTAGTQALVVFQREDNTSNGGNFTNTSSSDVWGMLLDMSSANGTAGQPFAIHASPFSDSEYPAVNRVAPGGASFSWVCAYQTYYNLQAGDDWDVVARRIGNDGSVTTSVFQSDLGLLNTHHQMRPRIAAVDRSYAILFTTTDLASTPGKTSATGGKEVRIERFDWTHGYAAPNPGADRPPVVLQSSTVRDLHCGAVAADANDFSHFAAAWYQRSAVPAPYYARIGYDGGITESGQIGNAVLVNDVACTFDQDHNTFLLVSDDDALPTRLNGALLGYNPAVPESLSGIGCNPALVYWVGTQQIGAEPVLAVSNALTGAGHLMLVSFATADVPVNVGGVAPNCRLLVDVTGAGYLGTLAFQIGPTVSWQISLPSWLPPLTLHFQDWILAGNQLSSTQRLTVPLVR